MKVIALTGKSDCGKSETLNIVYQFLLKDGYVPVQNRDVFEVLGNPAMRDFIDILEKDNKKVGIVTAGDYVNDKTDEKISIKSNLLKLYNASCDIAITACTTKNPKALIQVNNYSNPILVPKTDTPIPLSQERIINYFDAQAVLSKL